jgi:hypothetical protein
MRGALAGSFSAAAASRPQQVGMALTLNGAESAYKAGGMEGGQGFGMEEGTAGSDWAEEMVNQSEDEMEGVAGPDKTTTPTPTPARWATPTPVPVTPTKGSKRMAMGTPRPVRQSRPLARVRPMPTGFAAASALEQILAAIGALEKRTSAMEVAAEARHEQVGLKLRDMVTTAEKRKKELGSKLLALGEIETELAQKAPWEIQQWAGLKLMMQDREREAGEVRVAVETMGQQLAYLMAGGAVRAPAVPAAATEPTSVGDAKAPSASEQMEGVEATRVQGKPAEDMEGVERGGLYGSRHAPEPGEPDPSPMAAARKGKGKLVQVAVPTAPGPWRAPRGSAHQQRRQAEVNAAKVPAVPEILKRPETAAREEGAKEKRREEAARKKKEKAAATQRWEAGKMSEEEWKTYNDAASPIKALVGQPDNLEEAAAGQRVAHLAGMRALGSQWEEDAARARGGLAHQGQQQCQPREWEQRVP